MTDLAAWLLEQIAADEAAARAKLWTAEDEEITPGGDAWTGEFGEFVNRSMTFVCAWNPTRVLAECAAKRAIVEEHDGAGGLCYVCAEYDGPELMPQRWPCPTLRLLAQPYADRPGWREEWKL